MSLQAAASVFASLSPPCFSKCPSFLSPSSPSPLYHFCFPAPFPVPVASTFLFLDAWGFLMTLPAHRSLPYFQAASFYTLSVCCWFLQAPSSEAHVFERERQRLSEVTSRRTAKLGTVSGRGAAWRVQRQSTHFLQLLVHLWVVLDEGGNNNILYLFCIFIPSEKILILRVCYCLNFKDIHSSWVHTEFLDWCSYTANVLQKWAMIYSLLKKYFKIYSSLVAASRPWFLPFLSILFRAAILMLLNTTLILAFYWGFHDTPFLWMKSPLFFMLMCPNCLLF